MSRFCRQSARLSTVLPRFVEGDDDGAGGEGGERGLPPRHPCGSRLAGRALSANLAKIEGQAELAAGPLGAVEIAVEQLALRPGLEAADRGDRDLHGGGPAIPGRPNDSRGRGAPL